MTRPTPQSCSRARGTNSSAIIAWTRDLRWRQRQALVKITGRGESLMCSDILRSQETASQTRGRLADMVRAKANPVHRGE